MTSNAGENFKLIGAANKSTLIVDDRGFLIIDGIIVAHVTGDIGVGVEISSGGTLVMFDDKISNNTAPSDFGYSGVFNMGTFSLLGGEISDNRGDCGGVFNFGDFSMSGGKISNNTATWGGGVQNRAVFGLFGGEISDNTATQGGGVANYDEGTFSLFDGGVIDSNTAESGGGVLNMGIFSLSGGIISNNTVSIGGGVYIWLGADIFTIKGGVIANNTALGNGGGIYTNLGNLDKLFISDGVVFENNRASTAYNRDPAHDELYRAHIGDKVVWSEPFTQGYNNYDISYTSGVRVYVALVQGSYATSTGGGSYLAGVTVTVNAGTREGYTFSGWTVTGGVTLANSASATFTMPANNVVATANWTPVSSNSGGGGSGSGSSSGSSSNKPASIAPAIGSPTPSESGPNENDNVSPSPNNGEEDSASGSLWIIVLAVVIVLLAVVAGGVLFQKKRGAA